MNDMVNHPAHYTSSPAQCACGRGIECIDITRHFNFCRGNAIKYLWRAGLKGNAIEDLRKARKYLDFEIERLEGLTPQVTHQVTPQVDSDAIRFLAQESNDDDNQQEDLIVSSFGAESAPKGAPKCGECDLKSTKRAG